MKITSKKVDIKAEVIIFGEEKVLVLSDGEVQKEYNQTKIIPLYFMGRLLEGTYDEEDVKIFVIGKDNYIVEEWHIIGNYSDEDIISSIDSFSFEHVDSVQTSNKVILVFKEDGNNEQN